MFKLNGSLNILNFSDLKFPKFVMHKKVVNKTGLGKDPENSTQCFWDNYHRKLFREISSRKDETVESWNY